MNIHVAVSTWLLATMLFALVSEAQTPERKFPYQALVLVDGASVHSGPGEVHYSTDSLQQDTIVEVYRHDPGGWCAIKPPKGSFSLVTESALEKIDDRLGKVAQDGVQAWVGTRTGIVEKPLWQVKLREGEQVSIFGEASWPHPDGHSNVWYQISPPAGEFRWIRISDLQLPKNMTDLPVAETKTAGRIRTNIGNEELTESNTVLTSGLQTQHQSFDDFAREVDMPDPSFEDTPEPPSENNLAINRGWRRAKTPVRIADRRGIPVNQDPFTTPAIAAPSTVDALSSNSDNSNLAANLNKHNSIPNVDAATASTEIGHINGPATERIRLLENSLTNEMLKSPEQWQLESILRQATSISTNSNLIHERQYATRLVQKIRSCTSIQSRFESAYANSSPSGVENRLANSNTGSSSKSTAGSGLKAPTQLDNNVQFGATYDAHGWLNQLVRGRGSLQPTYVLENDKGQVTHHISPTPGLNLNRYLKSKIGIVGRRGFDNSLQLDHVTADRIVVIDQLRR